MRLLVLEGVYTCCWSFVRVFVVGCAKRRLGGKLMHVLQEDEIVKTPDLFFFCSASGIICLQAFTRTDSLVSLDINTSLCAVIADLLPGGCLLEASRLSLEHPHSLPLQ